MKIVAHDEDSMTNLFFSEIHRHDKLQSFLNQIEWRDHSEIPYNIADAELHQQVNFSEFGKPDALIIVTDNHGKKHIVIVEVKLHSYVESCSYNLENGKFNNKINSKLNNQLSLRYRAIRSLSSITDVGFITESEHTPNSPYSKDQVRRCKKPATCHLFKDILRKPFQFYLVTLTSDRESPFGVVDQAHKFFPIFFNQHTGTIEEFPNLGSVIWTQCLQLFEGIDNHFSESYQQHFEHPDEIENSPVAINPSDLFVRGRQIIKYGEYHCHLSCKGYSYAIRHFRNGRFVELDRGRGDRDKYLALQNRIQVLEKAPAKPIDNLIFWKNFFASKYGEQN